MNWPDLETRLADFLLSEVSPGIRLISIVLALSAAFVLGLVTSWGPHEKVLALEAEVREIRQHQRHLWTAYEAMRIRRDALELERADLRPTKLERRQ